MCSDFLYKLNSNFKCKRITWFRFLQSGSIQIVHSMCGSWVARIGTKTFGSNSHDNYWQLDVFWPAFRTFGLIRSSCHNVWLKHPVINNKEKVHRDRGLRYSLTIGRKNDSWPSKLMYLLIIQIIVVKMNNMHLTWNAWSILDVVIYVSCQKLRWLNVTPALAQELFWLCIYLQVSACWLQWYVISFLKPRCWSSLVTAKSIRPATSWSPQLTRWHYQSKDGMIMLYF